MVPRTRLKSRGDRAFAIAARRLWNSLPKEIKTAPTLSIIKSRLKTFLFDLAYYSCLAVFNSVCGYFLCTAHWSTVVVFRGSKFLNSAVYCIETIENICETVYVCRCIS